MARKRRLSWFHAGAVVIALFIALPLYWLIASSFKGAGDITSAAAFPPHPSGANYVSAFSSYSFGTYLANSAIVSVATTAAVLCLGTLAGYALGRLPLRGKTAVMTALLMISLFPTIAVLRNYFLGIPREMEEVAYLDGASPLRTVVSVIIPQALPGLFTAGIFTFVASWTEFIVALSLNSADRYRTIPVGIALFGGQFTTPYGTIFAASAVAMLPIAILVLVFRRAVVSGLTAGAVKG